MANNSRKKRKPGTSVVVLRQRDITKIKLETSDRALTLVTGYLMDEMDYDEQRIVELWEGVARYAGAINDHLITLGKVKDIIQDKTGIRLRWGPRW